MKEHLRPEPSKGKEDHTASLSGRESLQEAEHEPLLSSFAGLSGRIGIFGASVDPIHLGHIAGALAAAKEMELDRVVIIPTYQNPLKEHEPGASPAQRLQMVRNSLVDYPDLFVSDIELLKGQTPYTYETLGAIRSQVNDDAELFFIGGSDNLRSLHKWKEIASILEMAQFVTLSRNAATPEQAFEQVQPQGNLTAEHIVSLKKNYLHIILPEISSTEIRKEVAKGNFDSLMIPEAAKKIIQEQDIYSSNI